MTAFRHSARFVLLAASALAVGLAAGSIFGANQASAEEAILPPPEALPETPVETTVSFHDPEAALATPAAVGMSYRETGATRFAPQSPSNADEPTPNGGYELQLTADGASVGVPIDLAIAQRGNLSADEAGDVSRQGSGSELRVGQGLAQRQRSNSSGSSDPTWYVFAASDDEALTWNPGNRSAFGGQGAKLSLQDRVEIGDIQAGVTYERDGIQASIAYVEREVSTRVGNRSVSQDENFAGVTVTMRH